jgi:dimethylargininase
MYNHAIVAQVPMSFSGGISGSWRPSEPRIEPDYELARFQHKQYVNALEMCGLDVTILDADEQYPDSVFVEDTAVLTQDCAIICSPRPESRRGEIHRIERHLRRRYRRIEQVKHPGTLEGGDVLQLENEFLIAVSQRTNEEGATQLKQILEGLGHSVSVVDIGDMFHLKCDISYLGEQHVSVTSTFIGSTWLAGYTQLVVPRGEEYACNMLRINRYVLIPSGYPGTLEVIRNAGFEPIEVEMSEFRKQDGGLSCLSLRY